ncbi:hypothetical protein SAMN05421676_103306 [Salinibacillus kushneri]|uniref:N-acetyltransferase domain-containing protein n=1 Tax=Salinibacillus kushneri TaxID=237682 RepID=A0A1I0CVF4_9BACI|nr:hypothetical protein [Salinibacillus kushneri]SET23776.1 hypothetical protein SAMN05421676_103306 [Salinibacillus kushneri]
MVNIVPVREYDSKTVEDFFGSHWENQTNKQELLTFGRFIEIHGERKGFYAIMPRENDIGQLRTLYFTEQLQASLLLMLIDWVKEDASQNGYEQLLVFSHRLSTDSLFQTWGFEKITGHPPISVDKPSDEGEWWITNVNISTNADKNC